MMTQARDPTTRLAEAVQARRHRLGISQAELARRANVSERMVTKLENGQTGQRMTTQMSRVEQTLGWAPGSFQRIRDGAEPISQTTALETLETTTGQNTDDLGGLPLGLREQLTSGTVRDYEVIETAVSDTNVIAIFVRRHDEPPNREEVRRELAEWTRMRRALERLHRGEEGDGE